MSQTPSLTITHILEHLFCPRFTYFEYVLTVPERQELRWKVRKGREVHLERMKINGSYMRKKLGVVERQFDVPLASESLGLRGVADEILTLEDGTLAPFDYKFAKAPKHAYRTHKYQAALYAMLIAEQFGKPVERGFLCYIRSSHKVITLDFTPAIFTKAKRLIEEVQTVIRDGHLPMATPYAGRCVDCCYQNICIR